MKKIASPYSLSILCCLLFFTACENIIEFKGKDKANKLVVNHIVDIKQEEQLIDFSTSFFLFEDMEDWNDWDSSSEWQNEWNLPPGGLQDLPLEITVNGEPQEYYAAGGNYLAYRPGELKGGDKIAIEIDHELSGRVYVEETVPELPVILSVDTMRFFDFEMYSLFMRTLITIQDHPNERNYYRLLIRRKVLFDEGTRWEYLSEQTDYYINQDLALSSLVDQGVEDYEGNICRIFSDDLFDGGEYTLNVYFPLTYGSNKLKEKVDVEIELYSITESLYLYMRSIEQKWNSDTFSHPVRIYSNVKGGYGILGIQHPLIYRFPVARE
ncbi:DUF4249 domain-containing protein [Parabacteroides sp. OttesenSCG-928-O15]|nr:DUF4249 domain-containing protein [Parabacteroides sp. OttesenSCG-928-O15]